MPAGESCSAGIAEWDGGEERRGLVGRADAALYRGKARRARPRRRRPRSELSRSSRSVALRRATRAPGPVCTIGPTRTIEATKLAVSLLAPPRCGDLRRAVPGADPGLRRLRRGARRPPRRRQRAPRRSARSPGPRPTRAVARELVADAQVRRPARGSRAGRGGHRRSVSRPPPGRPIVAVPPAPTPAAPPRLRLCRPDRRRARAERRARRGAAACAALDGPRQVGRPRSERLGRPPAGARGRPAPRRVILSSTTC